MARELFETSLIKLEVIGGEANLQPDPFGLIEAATELVKLGFHVLPYCTEDWVVCKRLLDCGCEALMPWAAAIGTWLVCESCGNEYPTFLLSWTLALGFRHTPVKLWSGAASTGYC
jgi:thiazole synthase ThiGH ThiG subunit